MLKSVIALFLTGIAICGYGQSKPAYVLYNSEGKKVSYKKMIKTLERSDIILFGEYHNNPISHWLQYEVTNDLSKVRPLTLGAEMIERDNQDELEQYLSGQITAKGLDTTARLWPNYDTDYAPLVDFAKTNKTPFIGTNIPRRYASLVHRGGFEALDTLSDEEKSWIAPLPIAFDPELPTYKDILKMMGDHGSPRLVMAQAIKDATMAHFILANYRQGNLFIHYNGSFHSDYHEGIGWYLKQQNPALACSTVTTVSQEDTGKLSDENKGKADFIICVDENMTTTY